MFDTQDCARDAPGREVYVEEGVYMVSLSAG